MDVLKKRVLAFYGWLQLLCKTPSFCTKHHLLGFNYIKRTELQMHRIPLRASPRVCQILLGKSCVLPTSKKLCKLKKFISNSLA
jgi:hypothetical protein